MIAVNPSVAFCSARVRLAGLVADIVVVEVKLTCYVEDHHSLGGRIISRLDNCAFVGLIYSLLIFSQFHVEVFPPVTTTVSAPQDCIVEIIAFI